MIDKKISETIDQLIKKIKDNDLGSIKLSNKTQAIEISNNVINRDHTQNTHNINDSKNQNIKDKIKVNFLTIDSPMVGIIYLTPKPSSPPFVKKGQKISEGEPLVIFDDIALSILSITFNTLLYLNLPPKRFTSPDLEYNVKASDIFVLNPFTLVTAVES